MSMLSSVIRLIPNELKPDSVDCILTTGDSILKNLPGLDLSAATNVIQGFSKNISIHSATSSLFEHLKLQVEWQAMATDKLWDFAANVVNDFHSGASIHRASNEHIKQITSDPIPNILIMEELKNKEILIKKHEGVLHTDTPTADDVIQGKVGDCYLMAALSSFASEHPDWIKDMVKPVPDQPHHFEVSFYSSKKSKDGDVTFQKETYIVNSDLFTDDHGNKVFGKSADPGELWVSIVEKGYASFRDKSAPNYAKIESYNVQTVMTELTGIGAKSFEVQADKSPSGALTKLIGNKLKKDIPMAATSICYRNDQEKEKNEYHARTGLIANHVYSVLDLKEENGETFVQLRNPWGERESTLHPSDNVDDGKFWISLKNFQENFIAISAMDKAPTLH